MTIGIGGKYRVQIIENEDVIEDTGIFENLITNHGLSSSAPFGASGHARYLCIGAGVVTPPSVSDTNLGNEVALSSYGVLASPELVSEAEPWIFRISMTKDFTGINADISEVGLREHQPGTLISRSLIKDSNGDPITIKVKSNQTLRLTYYGYISFNDESATGSIVTSEFGTINYKVKRASAGSAPTTSPLGSARGVYLGEWFQALGNPGISSSHRYCRLVSDTGFNSVGQSSRVYPSVNTSTRTITIQANFVATASDRTVRGIIAGHLVRYEFDEAIVIPANQDFKINLSLTWGRTP